jgi:hypothetical protein
MLLLLGRSLQNVGSLLPQGAVLSPTLFNIFTSDFPTLTDVLLDIKLFAFDLAQFNTHAKADVISDRLQSALNTIKRYYSTWRVKLNSSKTQDGFFTKKRTRELLTTDLSLDGYFIPWSDRAIKIPIKSRLFFIQLHSIS